MNQIYLNTVRLLIAIAPAVFASRHFAMKGGTALNLFVQDLPRLSVDIDVVFVTYDLDRNAALRVIAEELNAAKARVERLGFRAEVRANGKGEEAKMFVTDGSSEVKVEVNYIFRGTVLPFVLTPLTPAAQEIFTANIEVPVLSTAELYGSKLVAALDRQHPRDLFDVLHMKKRFGLPLDFVDCFVAYLAGHNRPVHEVLFGNMKPLAAVFESEFRGMTTALVSLEDLESTRNWLFAELPNALTAAHRQFLLTLVQGHPEWSLMPIKHLKDLPAVRWKLMNLETAAKKNRPKFIFQHDELARRFAQLDV